MATKLTVSPARRFLRISELEALPVVSSFRVFSVT